jgi:hypothetical protein
MDKSPAVINFARSKQVNESNINLCPNHAENGFKLLEN